MTRSTAATIYRAVQGEIKHQTDRAILIKIIITDPPNHPENNKQIWFPLSQIASIHSCYDETNGTFDVLMASEWVLGTKGLLSVATTKNPALEIEAKRALERTEETKNNADFFERVKAKTAERKKLEKLQAARLPYKDDEDPVDNIDFEALANIPDTGFSDDDFPPTE